jgi:AraC-like DNA-binding protein
MKYLKKIRMERAAQLLANGFLSVKEVMASVGYNSMGHFLRHFKNTLVLHLKNTGGGAGDRLRFEIVLSLRAKLRNALYCKTAVALVELRSIASRTDRGESRSAFGELE